MRIRNKNRRRIRLKDFEMELVLRERKTRRRIYSYNGILDFGVFRDIEHKYGVNTEEEVIV